MKKTTLLLLLLLPGPCLRLFPQTPGPDWKTTAAAFFTQTAQLDQLARYLETGMDQIPTPEKAAAMVLLGYAYHQLGQTVNEKKWLVRYFETHEVEDPGFGFLSPREKVKLFEYHHRLRTSYPRLERLEVNRTSRRLSYFTPPEHFFLDIRVRAPAELVLKNQGMEIIFTRYLHRGPNTISLPYAPHFKKLKLNRFHLLLRTGTIEVHKSFILEAVYSYPSGIRFDPVTGKMAFTHEGFRPEKKQETLVETRRFFDKKHFRNKALLPIGAGLALLLLNRLVLHPASNRDSLAPGSRAMYNGADAGTAVLGGGLALKGILGIFRSFKKEHKKKTREVADPEALQHNRRLKERLKRSESQVFITYRLPGEKES